MYLCHCPSLGEIRARTGHRSLYTETKAESWRHAAHRLAFLHLLSLLTQATQKQLPKSGTTHSGLGHPTSVISQGNAPTEISRGQDKEGKASTEVLTVFPGASSLHQIGKDQPALYSKVPTAHLRRVSPSKFTLVMLRTLKWQNYLE